MSSHELADRFNIEIGKTKCSDNPHHDFGNCERCKYLEQEVAKKEAEKAKRLEEEKKEEDAKKKTKQENKCVGIPCKNPDHYLSGDWVHCPTEGEKETRACELYD